MRFLKQVIYEDIYSCQVKNKEPVKALYRLANSSDRTSSSKTIDN